MDNKAVTTSKPVAHIQALLDSFLTVASLSKARSGKRFQLVSQDKKMCFLLIEGTCDVKRSHDSLILSTIEAPTIVGISDLLSDPYHLIVQASKDIKYIYLPLDEVLLHVENNGLWKHVSYLLMYVSSRFNDYFKSNNSISTYELVCNLLRALSDEDFETRATVPAVSYILERTSLSRSGIMKMLSSLNGGGYIVIKRGLLIRINNLPEKY
ncbi:putative DNA-binding transcriptional regulator [Yersinia aldovae]|uniref:helix-turn-helix domain-containing protein n=1 Tax=Yersinia aldovae TaxID=29483 RepID=UPI0005E839D2|nr:helix-turn-helix domain-containing protein [Yersinia aldovae]CNI11540.1 putative DNA-binding transcriptional regulator [Yersinia aldovae]